MATFIEATETADEGKRKELMDKIVAYNKEDLEATWAVFRWLRSKKSPRQISANLEQRSRLQGGKVC
jgi:predicted RecB family nuclease